MQFPWKSIHQIEDIDDIIRMSSLRPQVIFKHSTRCNISSVARRRLEHSTIPEQIDFHLLDLISFRDISNKIAQTFDVWHESPQILLIVDGECIYDESHLGIDMEEIVGQSGAKIKG
jgi:bacillithiol system protein YtxJ